MSSLPDCARNEAAWREDALLRFFAAWESSRLAGSISWLGPTGNRFHVHDAGPFRKSVDLRNSLSDAMSKTARLISSCEGQGNRGDDDHPLPIYCPHPA
jgi:hypothetical protein